MAIVQLNTLHTSNTPGLCFPSTIFDITSFVLLSISPL